MSAATIMAPSTAPATSATQAPKQKPKGILHYLAVGLSMGVLAFVMLMALLVILIPVVSHSTPYTILTSSMSPDLPAGSLVVVKPTPIQDIHIGDIVTYQLKSGQPEVVTHRVIQIVEPNTHNGEIKLITKGDANSLPDPAVKPVQVRGVVWYSVPLIGWVNNVVNGGQRAVIVPILATALFVYAGYLFIAWLIERRRTRRAAVTGAFVARAVAVDEEPAQSGSTGRTLRATADQLEEPDEHRDQLAEANDAHDADLVDAGPTTRSRFAPADR